MVNDGRLRKSGKKPWPKIRAAARRAIIRFISLVGNERRLCHVRPAILESCFFVFSSAAVLSYLFFFLRGGFFF